MHEFRKQMIEDNVPHSLKSHETFYNLINGKTRPKDPYVYIYLAEKLKMTTNDVIMRYSDILSSDDIYNY